MKGILFVSFLASSMGTWFQTSDNTEICPFVLLSDDLFLLGLKKILIWNSYNIS